MNGIVMLTVNGMLNFFYKHKAILRLRNCYEYARQVTCDSRCFTVNIPNIHCKTAIFPVRDTGLIERCTLLEDENGYKEVTVEVSYISSLSVHCFHYVKFYLAGNRHQEAF